MNIYTEKMTIKQKRNFIKRIDNQLKDLGLDLTYNDLVSFNYIYSSIIYLLYRNFELNDNDIRFLEILEEYSYLLEDIKK